MSDGRQYYLMHKNEVVVSLLMEEENGSILNISSEGNCDLLPLGGNISPKDLKCWWERRAVPVSQGNMKRILMENGISSTQKYLLNNLGLSLSDHYWINPADEMLTWEEVNLFHNDFKDEIGELQFQNGIGDIPFREEIRKKNHVLDIRNQTTFYPSASLQGELRKKWVVQDGKRYLIKGNYGQSWQQSINEVIATKLHEKQNKVAYTRYSLCELSVEGGAGKEDGLGCICEDFATEKLEFIPAYDVSCAEKKKNDRSEFEHFIYMCVKYGLEEQSVREFLEYQILSDFVLTNTDRHFNNFGVLRDTDTLRFVGMAPIFDSGNSMFWNRRNIPEKDDLLDISVSSFRKREVELLRYVTQSRLIDISLLPTDEEIRSLLGRDPMLAERVEMIVNAYRKKIHLLERFQNGERIYQRRG